MFTISSYTFHPLVARFINLWRWARLVSGWLTGVLFVVCCQCCGDVMPLSTSTCNATRKHSFESFQIISKPMIDPGKACGEPLRAQHVSIDFGPHRGDYAAVEEKCYQFWEFVNSQPQLEGMMVVPNCNTTMNGKPSSMEAKAVDSKFPPRLAVEDAEFPAIHCLRKLQNKDILKTAFTK